MFASENAEENQRLTLKVAGPSGFRGEISVTRLMVGTGTEREHLWIPAEYEVRQ